MEKQSIFPCFANSQKECWAYYKEIGKPGNLKQKEFVEAYKKHKRREGDNFRGKFTPTKNDRLRNMYLQHCDLGTTGREGHRHTNSTYDVHVYRSDRNEILALVKMEGWIQYSRNSGWFVSRAFLVGKDKDSGWFSIQVASSCESVKDALEWIKPAPVKKAEKEGRQVYRQGDVYFIQMKRNCYIGDTNGHSYTKTDTGYIIKHNEHEWLTLDGHNWKAYSQKSAIGKVKD